MAAISCLFQADRSNKRASGKESKGARLCGKTTEENWGAGEREGGVGGKKRNHLQSIPNILPNSVAQEREAIMQFDCLVDRQSESDIKYSIIGLRYMYVRLSLTSFSVPPPFFASQVFVRRTSCFVLWRNFKETEWIPRQTVLVLLQIFRGHRYKWLTPLLVHFYCAAQLVDSVELFASTVLAIYHVIAYIISRPFFLWRLS